MGNIEHLKRNRKLKVEKLEALENKHGIQVKANAYVEWDEYEKKEQVRVIAEIFGDTIQYDVKFILNVYNKEDEIIASQTSAYLTKETFEGIDSVEVDAQAPKGEKIFRVLLFPQKC